VRSHLACILIAGTLLEDLKDFEGHVSESLYGDADGPKGQEFGDLLPEMLQTRGRWLGSEPIKGRLRLVRASHEELIEGGTNRRGEPRSHACIEIMKEAVECRPDNSLQL
jgi:hypothetical protein